MRFLTIAAIIMAHLMSHLAATPHLHASQSPDHDLRPHVHFGRGHAHSHGHESDLPRDAKGLPSHDETCIFLDPALADVAKTDQRQANSTDAVVCDAPSLIQHSGCLKAPPHPPPVPRAVADLVILWRTLRI